MPPFERNNFLVKHFIDNFNSSRDIKLRRNILCEIDHGQILSDKK